MQEHLAHDVQRIDFSLVILIVVAFVDFLQSRST
jgi:hypothetical protein